MKFSYYRSKDNWEQARLIAYLQAQTHSSKKLKIEDIIKFPWETDVTKTETISKEQIEQLSNEADEIAKLFAAAQ